MNNVIKRQMKMVSEHKEIRRLIIEDAVVKAWFESWSRSEKTVEDGLVDLVKILCEVKNSIQSNYENVLATSSRPIMLYDIHNHKKA